MSLSENNRFAATRDNPAFAGQMDNLAAYNPFLRNITGSSALTVNVVIAPTRSRKTTIRETVRPVLPALYAQSQKVTAPQHHWAFYLRFPTFER